MKHISHALGPITTEDTLRMLVGEKIGEGQFREVYTCPIYSGSVVKISREHGNVSNVLEWMLWGELTNTRWQRWLCPCQAISPCGTALLMAKASPLVARPRRVPSLFSDMKPENWGTVDGKPVVLDYGNNALFTILLGAMKLEPAKWLDNSDKRLPRRK